MQDNAVKVPQADLEAYKDMLKYSDSFDKSKKKS